MARMLVIGALVLLVAGMFPPPATARGLPSSGEISTRSESGCPEMNPDIKCIRYDEACSDEESCPAGGLCCPYKCGTACYVPLPETEVQDILSLG